MIKFLVNIVEIAILIRVTYSVGKFLFKRKMGKGKKRGLSIAGKVMQLFANKVHYSLDKKLKAQKEKWIAENPQSTSNVIPLKKYRKA